MITVLCDVQVSDVDQLLTKYKSNELALLAAVKHKYGSMEEPAEPTTGSAHTARSGAHSTDGHGDGEDDSAAPSSGADWQWDLPWSDLGQEPAVPELTTNSGGSQRSTDDERAGNIESQNMTDRTAMSEAIMMRDRSLDESAAELRECRRELTASRAELRKRTTDLRKSETLVAHHARSARESAVALATAKRSAADACNEARAQASLEAEARIIDSRTDAERLRGEVNHWKRKSESLRKDMTRLLGQGAGLDGLATLSSAEDVQLLRDERVSINEQLKLAREERDAFKTALEYMLEHQASSSASSRAAFVVGAALNAHGASAVYSPPQPRAASSSRWERIKRTSSSSDGPLRRKSRSLAPPTRPSAPSPPHANDRHGPLRSQDVLSEAGSDRPVLLRRWSVG